MKTTIKKLSVLLLAFVFQSAFGQTVTGSFTQIPCNNDGIYSVSTTGLTPPITYTYYLGNTSVVHANVNSTTDQLTNIPMNNYGGIYCAATDGTSSAGAQNSYTPAFQFTLSATVPICPATLGVVTATQTSGTPGPFSFIWTNKQTLISYTGNNASVPLGEYEVDITDQTTGCVLSIIDSGLYVYQQSSVTASINVTPASCTNGTATAVPSGGVAPYTYLWSTGATTPTISGLSQGYYSLTVTDAQGCQSNNLWTYIQQTVNISVSFSTTPANCNNGTITAIPTGGTPPYTYLWNNGATTPTISGLGEGSYSVTVTDAQGCQSNNLSTYLQQAVTLSINTVVSDATCVQSDGSIIAFASGGVAPYTYSWSNGQTGNTAVNLAGGANYQLIVTDANGCTGQKNTYVNSSTPISVTYNSTPSQCTSATGSATLSPTGGTPPYTYFWNSDPSNNSATISNIDPGNYSFKVTDAVGCVRTGTAVVSPISTLNLNLSAPSVICPNTIGNVTSLVSGSNPPFTYLWSNGATTNQINNVPLGSYSCVVTDDLGCSVTKYASLQSTSSVTISLSTTPASCVFDSDGTATASGFGGVAPYTYSYSNGSTTSSASGLGVGNYTVSVTDANGCSKSKYFNIGNSNVSTSCYCTISGNVYLDANANCVNDAGESGLEDIMIHCSGYGYAFTDANGYYSFQVPTGSYTITQQINPYFPLASCQNNNVPVSVVAATGCNSVVDFANEAIVIHDLKIITVNSTLPPIPGNNYQQKVIVQNQGTVTESDVQLGYEHDGQLTFTSSTLPSFMQVNAAVSPNYYGVQTGFPSLSPNAYSTMLLDYSTPTNIPIGTVVDFIDTVADVAPINVNWLLDNTPWNNVNQYQTVVIGSYDPNYKEVTPRGEGVEGFVTSDVVEFDYTIHFQNEGTYFANKVVITDQLDSDFDWATFKPGYSDYDFTTTMTESGLVSFTFENIKLPWKDAYGDALSSGFVTYSIERNSSVPQGTEFTNEANIYFDYNAPITTNTTLNTLKDVEDTTGIHDEGNGLVNAGTTVDLFPIPANNAITLRVHNKTNNKGAMFQIVDVMGKVVFSDNIELNDKTTAKTFDISKLTKGAYFTQIQFDDGSRILKKIILH